MAEEKKEGRVSVTFVVDTAGLADTTTFQVISTTHADFTRAVYENLPHRRFTPLEEPGTREMSSRKFRQTVFQEFTFWLREIANAKYSELCAW
jgi:hypothetical protein